MSFIKWTDVKGKESSVHSTERFTWNKPRSRLFAKWCHAKLPFQWSHPSVRLPELVNCKFNEFNRTILECKLISLSPVWELAETIYLEGHCRAKIMRLFKTPPSPRGQLRGCRGERSAVPGRGRHRRGPGACRARALLGRLRAGLVREPLSSATMAIPPRF